MEKCPQRSKCLKIILSPRPIFRPSFLVCLVWAAYFPWSLCLRTCWVCGIWLLSRTHTTFQAGFCREMFVCLFWFHTWSYLKVEAGYLLVNASLDEIASRRLSFHLSLVTFRHSCLKKRKRKQGNPVFLLPGSCFLPCSFNDKARWFWPEGN